MSVAAISTYAGQFFSGEADPSIPHLVLILAAVIGGLAVGAGIIWEAAREGHLWELPTALVFVGVVLEAAATVILFQFDEGISSHQKSVIEAQNDRIIALDTEIAPRKLTKEQYDALQSLKGRMSRINVSTETEWETWSFAIQISKALADAGIRAPIFVRRSYLAHTIANMLYDRYAFSNPFGAPTKGEPLASV